MQQRSSSHARRGVRANNRFQWPNEGDAETAGWEAWMVVKCTNMPVRTYICKGREMRCHCQPALSAALLPRLTVNHSFSQSFNPSGLCLCMYYYSLRLVPAQDKLVVATTVTWDRLSEPMRTGWGRIHCCPLLSTIHCPLQASACSAPLSWVLSTYGPLFPRILTPLASRSPHEDRQQHDLMPRLEPDGFLGRPSCHQDFSKRGEGVLR